MRASGLVITPDAFFISRIKQVAALTARHSVPAIYGYREFAVAGGLMSYGGSLTDTYRTAGIYTGRILKGEKSAIISVGTHDGMREQVAACLISEAGNTIAAAIDVALKQTIRIVLNDTSSAKLTYMRSTQSDEQELQTIYRRDLIYEVEYATLFQFPGYVITSTTINLQGGTVMSFIAQRLIIASSTASIGLFRRRATVLHDGGSDSRWPLA
jgi:hypothetical protein